VVTLGSRSSGRSRCRPQVWAHSMYAVSPTSRTSARAGRPSGSHADTGMRQARTDDSITSRKPGPPSESGRTTSSSAGATDRHPATTAAAAWGADRVPANLSGQTSTRMAAQSASPECRPSHSARSSVRRPRGTMDNVTWTEPSSTATALLLLGRGADPKSERGVDCPGDLPAPSDPDLVARAAAAKAALGDRVFVLGHHYQRDEVVQFADVTGDSFKLARDAAARPEAEYIVFCGVHFMAESADILTRGDQKVILPDLAAGCSMADMAALSQVEQAWDVLTDAGVAERTIPVTYMNSSADIKGFVGRSKGVVCTSSNAERALRWAYGRGDQVLFLPA